MKKVNKFIKVKKYSSYDRKSHKAKNTVLAVKAESLKIRQLAEEWFGAVRPFIKDSTAANYRLKLEKHIFPELADLLSKLEAPPDCYLISGSESPLEPRTLQYRFKKVLRLAGLPGVNFHSLRHSFATDAVALGFDAKTLSEILGHSSVRITLDRYVHSSIDRKRRCMELIDG